VLQRALDGPFQRELGTIEGVRGSAGCTKQSCVALSTTEAAYLTACAVAVWLRELLSGLFGLRLEATYIWCDN
jgi:hypothetical protein